MAKWPENVKNQFELMLKCSRFVKELVFVQQTLIATSEMQEKLSSTALER